jgi:hypothetical protein
MKMNFDSSIIATYQLYCLQQFVSSVDGAMQGHEEQQWNKSK